MFSLSTILLLVGISAIDSAPTDTLTAVELDPIIVMGRREPQRLSQAVNSALQINRATLATIQTSNIVNHLSSSYASITVSSVRSNGFGLGPTGHGQLLIRGLGFSPNRSTLVLIDGRPDIAGLFGHPLPDTYQRAGLSSVELLKGASSTLYGSNAISGVLNLESFYRPDYDHFTNIELTAGSFQTVNAIAQHSHKVGKAILAGWYQHLESNNDGINNEFLGRSGGFRAQWNDVARMNLFVSGKYSSFVFTDPGPDFDPLRTTGDIQRSGLTLGADRHEQNYSLSLRAYSSYGEHTFSDGFNSVDRNNGFDLFARRQFAIGLSRLTFSGGTSFNQLGGSANNGSPFVNNGNFSENEFAAHFQTEYNWSQKITLIGGGRFIDHDRYDGHFVYQLATVLTPGNIGSLKLSLATAYRNPTINETQLFIISNSDSLEPETGKFYEIGYFNKITPLVSIETAVFWRNGENLIATLPNPSPQRGVSFQNTGNYSHSGWEATVRFSHGHWSASPSFMHLNQDNYNLAVPKDKLVTIGSYTDKLLRFDVEMVAAFKTGGQDPLGAPVFLDNYFVTNLSSRIHTTNGPDVILRIENLFNTKYEIVSGYKMPEITFRGGLAWQIF